MIAVYLYKYIGFALKKKEAMMAYSEEIIQGLCEFFEQNHILKGRDAKALEHDFKKSGVGNFEDFLLEEGIVSKEDLLDALSAYYQVAAFDADGEFFEHNLVRMFPKDVMLRHAFIPLSHDGDVLIVVTADPNNPMLDEIIGRFVSYDVTYVVGLSRDIEDAVKEFYDESVVAPTWDASELEESFDEEEAREIEEEGIDRIGNRDHYTPDE